ncbi:hypothetical protein H7X87_01475, partial [Acetobacteraceae bacterium]|nr:hypothetical protein [Candidatus Parcubacteria bacterium]
GRRGEDLIWNGSSAVPRAGKASVKLVFDNSDRALDLDFDNVSIERAVHRDGVNDYGLNGSSVRLRDVAELLSQANIGASGHHIISQGEADRILSASSRERREMIEDALGLTQYLYKREEAERKLEKTAENMREVEALRRELAPHIKFLAGQVRKIEESETLREELKDKYLEYLKREHVYIRAMEEEVKEALEAPMGERTELDKNIEHLRRELGSKGKSDAGTHELIELESKGRHARDKRESINRELGRIEGERAAHEKLAVPQTHIPASEARIFAERVEKELEEFAALDGSSLKSRISALTILAKEFLRRLTAQAGITAGSQPKASSASDLTAKQSTLENELAEIQKEEERVNKEVSDLRRRIESEKDASREAERELFSAMAKRSELEVTLASLRAKESVLLHEKEAFKAELGEAGVLLGPVAAQFDTWHVRDEGGEVTDSDMMSEERALQKERARRLERMKIKLEATSTSNAQEILKEHQETSERDQFLARELIDLETSAGKLGGLISELTETLEVRFVGGIDKINAEFDRFFKLMFGGGAAVLSIVKEKKLRRGVSADIENTEHEEPDEEVEEGIDISVNLPHKRLKGLHMLSGGERALTSIALIFAMSQVNPPPFLILDETDAALDEANSRRYGDMIESLSKKSQLILITHNRETMSRAGVLYGVTMGSDGASKLLSVKFEDALAVAK